MRRRIKKAPSNRGLRPLPSQLMTNLLSNQKSPIKSGIKTHNGLNDAVLNCGIKKAPSNRGLRLFGRVTINKQTYTNQKSPIKSGIKTLKSRLFALSVVNQKSPIKSGIKTKPMRMLLVWNQNQKSPIKSGIKTAVNASVISAPTESKKPHQIGD